MKSDTGGEDSLQKKRAVIAHQKQEAQEELARLQSSVEFAEMSMNIQSDEQIIASKAKNIGSCQSTNFTCKESAP